MKNIEAKLDMAVVQRAYAQMGPRNANNLVRRAMRKALGLVRDARKLAWTAAPFREGRSVGRKKRIRRVRFSTSWKLRRTGTGRAVVVRKAIARATRLSRVDRLSNGKYVGAVGVDYSLTNLKTQQRMAHFLESGRSTGRKGRVLGRGISRRINERLQPRAEAVFVQEVAEGIKNAVR